MTNIESSAHLWSDQPASMSNINGREKFAEVVSARIDQCQLGQPSTVFGLVGPWGSGKTTLITEITDSLDNWNVVNFSPWSASDTSALSGEFVAALSAAFPKARRIQKRLKSYARFGAPALALIPGVGGFVSELAGKVVSDFANGPSWYVEFKEISAEIEKQRARVLVVVDDVDRLDGDELRALFRVVRLLGRFTNVHYLLAYDQSTIDELLAAAGAGGHSSDFMEKIVQYPFEVPPTPKVIRRRWAREIVDLCALEGSEGAGESAYAEQKDELIRVLASGLETPRAANRLREQVSSLMGLIQPAEIDALDFLALTWIRITHHKLWDHIRLHQDHYLGWRESDDEKVRADRDRAVIELVDRGLPSPAQLAVHFLFDPITASDVFAQRRWRIKNLRFFDRYFLFGVPEDDVSELLIERALQALEVNDQDDADVNDFRRILEGDYEDRSVLALETVNRLRRTREVTSTGLLDFIDHISANEPNTSTNTDALSRALESWLYREIYLALSNNVITDYELVHRYGYERLTFSAFSARREMRSDGQQVRDAYKGIAIAWLDDIKDESLGVVLERPEKIALTSFLIWIQESDDRRGFLSKRVTDAEKLLAVATGFVGFSEWVGSGISYEVVFREQEFRFAVGDALTLELIEDLPPRTPQPDYATNDLTTRELSKSQRRDFALRSLGKLDIQT